MKTTPASYLRKIKALRIRHTENFKAERWHLNDNIGEKIIASWDAWHRIVAKFGSAKWCFWCGKPNARFLLLRDRMPTGERFCCKEHRAKYGVLKGCV